MRKLVVMILLLTLLMSGALVFAGGDPEDEIIEGTAMEEPTKLHIPIVLQTALESPWNTAFLQTAERVKAEKPHGLDISWDVLESIGFPDAERVLRELAISGKYDMIWANSSFSDSLLKLHKEFPDILWVVTGGGNSYVGDNVYWVDIYAHEPAYLLGVIAGMMTETDVIGAVAAYPYPNVNMPVNAYREGALSVNPNVKLKMTYIESWFDPQKGKESALAQIASGADFIYAERFGPFEAAREKGVLAFGHQVDQHDLAPDVVVSSNLQLFDPSFRFIIDEWWDHVTNGTPYKAPETPILYTMAEGGADIAPYHAFESKLPADVKEAVAAARQDILDGKFTVPALGEPVESQ